MKQKQQMDNPTLVFDGFVERMGKIAKKQGDEFRWRCTSPKEHYIKLEFFRKDGSLFHEGEGTTLEEAIDAIEEKL